MSAGLVARSRHERLRAVREAAVTDALPAALRRVLYTDHDANVRAAAARRLGELAIPLSDEERAADPLFHGVLLPEPPIEEGWLLDALEDPSPLVREAILRALARCGSTRSAAALRALIAGDRMWWVRRSAIYALAAIAGAGELATFTEALADPFWRVRHAAVQVLVVLGARDPELREELALLDAPPSATLAFLRSSWGPAAIEAPVRATAPSALPPALLDPDPAVVAARLATDRDVTPKALVELLCDPHESLRTLAARRLADTGDLDALEAALDWLEEPRIPHVADTVEALVDRLGDRALQLAHRVLARPAHGERPGATRWAIGWVVAARETGLYDAARARARQGDAGARRAAIPIATTDDLVVWATTPALAAAAAAELHARREHAALARLDGSLAPRVRTLQVDAAARAADWPRVEPALHDLHHGPRAVAARWLVGAGRIEAQRLASDPDPAVREAALVPATAPAALADRDPWVRRAAIQTLAACRADALPAGAIEAVLAAARADDPWVRQAACRVAVVEDRQLVALVAALADPDEMVRAAALEGLEAVRDDGARLHALLPALPADHRALAYGWLLRRGDDLATWLAREALTREPTPEVRRVLGAVLGERVEVPPAAEPPASIAPSAPAAPVEPVVTEHRAFGRAGFSVAPLAISGAYDLSTAALEEAHAAGVDLYFWEPGYDRLTSFLRPRRERTRVITGSYHADAASLRRDVESALRVLRRDTLDAFLLFWTRSPARVDAAAYDALDRLRREGKVRAVGFSTHARGLARAAIEATPWDVVMIRHSAAHPGIETELLPAARERGTAIVTFSALTYGRMLTGPGAPSPAECYRYSLAQPGVTACISAPRTRAELVANLEALATPSLPAERVAELRSFGTSVRAESQRFNGLMRQPTRDAAAAARELLAAELPPEDGTTRTQPAATRGRRSRARLGRKRR